MKDRARTKTEPAGWGSVHDVEWDEAQADSFEFYCIAPNGRIVARIGWAVKLRTSDAMGSKDPMVSTSNLS